MGAKARRRGNEEGPGGGLSGKWLRGRRPYQGRAPSSRGLRRTPQPPPRQRRGPTTPEPNSTSEHSTPQTTSSETNLTFLSLPGKARWTKWKMTEERAPGLPGSAEDGRPPSPAPNRGCPAPPAPLVFEPNYKRKCFKKKRKEKKNRQKPFLKMLQGAKSQKLLGIKIITLSST